MSFNAGLCSVSFRKFSPEEILKNMNSAGLSYIEWGSDIHVPICDVENAKAIARLQSEYKVKCSSYGTYFKIPENSAEELYEYIKIAKILGTNIIRFWCGNKNSEDYTESEKEEFFAKCKKAAETAKENGIVMCAECHVNTYTSTKESALELMESVNCDSFRMYWQPNQFKSKQENLEYAALTAAYTVNIHVFNWKGKEKYPLQYAAEEWKEYLAHFSNATLLLEFMPDGKMETLAAEAKALKEIIG